MGHRTGQLIDSFPVNSAAFPHNENPNLCVPHWFTFYNKVDYESCESWSAPRDWGGGCDVLRLQSERIHCCTRSKEERERGQGPWFCDGLASHGGGCPSCDRRLWILLPPEQDAELSWTLSKKYNRWGSGAECSARTKMRTRHRRKGRYENNLRSSSKLFSHGINCMLIVRASTLRRMISPRRDMFESNMEHVYTDMVDAEP